MKKVAIDVLEFSKPYQELSCVLKEREHLLTPINKVDLGDPSISLFIFAYPHDQEYINTVSEMGFGKKMVLILMEPPVVQPGIYDRIFHEKFRTVLTWNDELVDGKKYLKFYWPNSWLGFNKSTVPFVKKKLVTLVSARKYSSEKNELYSERERAIEFFESSHPDEFDLYGRLWNTPLNLKERIFGVPLRPSYRGEIPDKMKTLSRYKFNICYENMGNVQGYITEKIIESLEALCVPVYLGASNINRYIPETVFIDRRKFHTYEELYKFIRNMDEKTYLRYVESAKEFLLSKQARVWFERGWAEHLSQQLPF